jgi:dTDP-4-amino-4,6-dideoxygalactose transaminase
MNIFKSKMPASSKISVDELSLFSRKDPLFDSFIPVGRPNMGSKQMFMEYIDQMWDSRMLANRGPLVQKFERALCNYLGVRNFVTICNGTIALEIAAKSLGMSGEVIVPSFTFIATAHCLQWQEITPVFCDVDPVKHTIDPNKVESLITPRTTGIIAVHLWGQPCDTEALERIAKKHNLKLMYDAAHAMGCSHNNKKIGNFGDCEIFSFHATKFFNTFEGGGVATNNDDLAEDIRRRANFGFIGYDNVVCVGTNGKMIEPCAAIGLTNLLDIGKFIDVNRLNYLTYKDGLSNLNGVSLFNYDSSASDEYNFQYIVLEIDESITMLTRDEIVALLTAENLSARRYFFPGCHRMEPYKSYFPHAHILLPLTKMLCNKIICLPTGTGITLFQISQVCEFLRFILDHASEIKKRISSLDFPLPIAPGELAMLK